MKITGIILAGGKSSRMEKEKALLNYKGKKLIDWPLELFKEICEEIIISSNSSELDQFGYKRIEDEYKDIGPISGLYSGLKVSKSKNNIVIACDTPHLNPLVYRRLLDSSKNYDAVIAGFSKNYIEPLIAYYNKNIVNVLEKQIQNKEYKLLDVLDHINYKTVFFSNKDLFKNINYPSDL